MREAYKRADEIYLNELDNGRVELIWKRRHTQHLSEVLSTDAKTPHVALNRLIALEDDFALRRDHGDACDCEDCCIARVDRERSGRR